MDRLESLRQGEIIRALAAPPLAVQADISELAKALCGRCGGPEWGPWSNDMMAISRAY